MFPNRTFRLRFCWPPRSVALLLIGPAILLLLVIWVAPLVRRGVRTTVDPEQHSSIPPSGRETLSDEENEKHSSFTDDDEVVRDKPTPDDDCVVTFPLVNEFSLGPGIKRFDNEDARLIGFPVVRETKKNVTTGDGKKEEDEEELLLFLATRFFGEWNPRHFYFLHSGNTTFSRYRCPVSDCHVTRDPSLVAQAHAVLFHVRDTEVFSVPSYRSPEQLWILYSMEPPWLEVRDMRRFDGLFNWTMGYRDRSDVRVRYGFVGKRRRRKGTDAVPRVVPRHKADRAVWLVSDCNTDSNREGFVRRLREVFPVDIVGGCGSGSGCRPAESRRCYLEVARRYKFYLAFENALCRDYVTEKLFNALEYFVVPVVLGGADYSRLVPRGSVIDAASFPSPEVLGRYLWRVSRNDSLYLSHFEWKVRYASYLQPWMCDLCERLHRHRDGGVVNNVAKTGRDLERWWHGERRCLRWTEDGFREVERHPFPKYRMRLFADDDDERLSKSWRNKFGV